MGRRSISPIIVLFLSLSLTFAGLIVSPAGLLSPIVSFSVPQKAQGILGNVTYNRVAPRCGADIQPWPNVNYYARNEIAVSSMANSSLTFPIEWNLLRGCLLLGTYRIGLDPGIYYVDFTGCFFEPVRVGDCATLPARVVVTQGNFTAIDMYFTTSLV